MNTTRNSSLISSQFALFTRQNELFALQSVQQVLQHCAQKPCEYKFPRNLSRTRNEYFTLAFSKKYFGFHIELDILTNKKLIIQSSPALP